MSIETELKKRSAAQCELCASPDDLCVYALPPESEINAENAIYVCPNCLAQIENPDQLNPHHWHCLNESMWSQVPAVQVMAWRILKQLRAESWAQDLLDMLYLEDDVLAWAQAGFVAEEDKILHKDSNGNTLQAGDTVSLIKDLNVKGANFTAKRGTAVRNIALVSDNAEQIEGKVNGQQIVILTQYVKKI